ACSSYLTISRSVGWCAIKTVNLSLTQRTQSGHRRTIRINERRALGSLASMPVASAIRVIPSSGALKRQPWPRPELAVLLTASTAACCKEAKQCIADPDAAVRESGGFSSATHRDGAVNFSGLPWPSVSAAIARYTRTEERNQLV